ncbi:MAG: ribonuclease R [Planctomycetota bacterium]|nr:ribonuclease R [Planctomycetota bacterium]
MNEEQLEQAILQLVSAKNYQPVKPRRIARQLKLADDETRDVKRVVKQLVKEGRLTYAANHAVCLPDHKSSNQITGIFRRMSDGYGFVRPSGALAKRDRDEDVYIPKLKGADAASGDLVLVQISRRTGGKPGRSLQGAIVKVLERETHDFVGTYFERSGYGFVQVDGKIFTQPILVGDAGAKDVKIDDKVVIEMVRFPSHVHDGEAVILKVLGQRGEPGVDTLSIIHEFNLPGEFGEDVLEDARDRAEQFDATVGEDRRDLTKETVITIDPVDARDFDDAISLEQIEGGHWRLGVHIADVSYFVRDKSALDREAKDRATSVYLPDRVIPMLPETISNNLASLQPNRVRYTKSVFIEFTPDGAPIGAEACAAAIRSKRRFTYEEVDDYRAHPTKWRKNLKPAVYDLLGRMYTLAMILRQRRFDRGALELTMPEVKIELDDEGRVSGAHLVENTESHQVIEEFMLAANEAVAEMLHAAGLVFLRRIHEPPDPRKLKELSEFTSELGFGVDSLESRFELQGLLHQVKGRPEEHAVNYAALRSLQKAVYSPEDEGHFALASDCYCHFTSPIRRYPDLTVHRLLDALLAKHKPKQHFDELATLGDHCSQREQRAEQAERELIKVKLLNYLSERIGEEMDGVVTGVQEFGLFVQGIKLPAEGLIHVTSLQDDYYHYDRPTHSLSGHRSGNSFRLGDYLRVAVAHVDVDRRELDFRLVRRLKNRPEGPATKAARRKSSQAKAPKKGKAARKKSSTRQEKKKTVSATGRKKTKKKRNKTGRRKKS